MTHESPTNEIDDLGERFRLWKQNNPHRHVPKEYWNVALEYSERYGPFVVAESIGCAPSLILHKQYKKQKVVSSNVEFVEIQQSLPTFNTDHTSNPIQVNIQNSQGLTVNLSFQGNLEQIFPLVATLFKEGVCSK